MKTAGFLKKTLFALCAASVLMGVRGAASAAESVNYAAGTHLVFLGTGTPVPDPRTQGPALALIVNGKPYLVDTGVGLVRQAAAAFARGVTPLGVNNLDTAFITHLHSDHTLGLPDLIYTPWIFGRTAPLALYGPSGTADMVRHIQAAWSQDIDARINGGEGGNQTGYKVKSHEIVAGTIYQDTNVKVTALRVSHINWKNAFAFRFDTADGKSVVVSGDRRDAPDDRIEQLCNGCDVLVHEVFDGDGLLEHVFATKRFPKTSEQWRKYMLASHTAAEDLARIATNAKAKTLILHHQIFLGEAGEAEMIAKVRKGYRGEVKFAHDLDVHSAR